MATSQKRQRRMAKTGIKAVKTLNVRANPHRHSHRVHKLLTTIRRDNNMQPATPAATRVVEQKKKKLFLRFSLTQQLYHSLCNAKMDFLSSENTIKY